MAYELWYDAEVLSAQGKNVHQISTDLRDAAKKLSNNLDQLKNDWQSDAGDKFFSIYETSWVQHVEEYCAMLDEVGDELVYASSEYHGVTEALSTVQF